MEVRVSEWYSVYMTEVHTQCYAKEFKKRKWTNARVYRKKDQVQDSPGHHDDNGQPCKVQVSSSFSITFECMVNVQRLCYWV